MSPMMSLDFALLLITVVLVAVTVRTQVAAPVELLGSVVDLAAVQIPEVVLIVLVSEQEIKKGMTL